MIIGTPPQPPVERRASLHNLSGYVTSLSHTFSFCRLLSLLVGPSGRGIGGANLEPSTDGLHEVPGNRPCPNRCRARITLLRPEEVVVVVVVVVAAAAAAAAVVVVVGVGVGVVVVGAAAAALTYLFRTSCCPRCCVFAVVFVITPKTWSLRL